MVLHLIKLAVGIESVAHLRERQRQRLAEQKGNGSKPRLRILTRNTPRRGDEILAGQGALYWVIKGHVLVRQPITAIEPATDSEGQPRCAIYLDERLIPVRSRRSRPFQGWRYLEGERAPPDAGGAAVDDDDAPPEMAAELRELGLL